MTPTATAPRQLAALLVAHAQLVPSLTNPRKRFDKDRLEELALSMAPPVGILEPLVVRLLPAHRDLTKVMTGPGPFYEIIAGERRWRAAAIAKLDDIPIVVRDIADDQVIKLQLVENKNREDIHPLDEAEAMERLLKMNKAETPKTIAATIGMSERYVQNRLHYIRLTPAVKEAFRREEITAGHVDLIMRLAPADQEKAFAACHVAAFDFEGSTPEQMQQGDTYDLNTLDDATSKTRKPVQRLISVRELDSWIRGNVRLDVTPGSAETRFFPELREALKPSTALPDDTLVKAGDVPPPAVLLQVSDSYEFYPAKGDKTAPPLTREDWRPIEGKKDRCEFAQRAVVVLGKRRAELIDVCTAKGKCKKHWAHTVGLKQTPTRAPGERRPKAEIEAEKRAKAARDDERQLQELRKKAMDVAMVEARKKAPNAPTPALLKLLTVDMRGRSSKPLTWRDVAIEALEHSRPYHYSLQSFKEFAGLVALLGVKVEAPTLPKKAAAPKQAPARDALKKNARPGVKKALAKRKAGAKK